MTLENIKNQMRIMKKQFGCSVKIDLLHKYEGNYKIYKGCKARYLSEILLYINNQHLFDSECWSKKAIEADQKMA